MTTQPSPPHRHAAAAALVLCAALAGCFGGGDGGAEGETGTGTETGTPTGTSTGGSQTTTGTGSTAPPSEPPRDPPPQTEFSFGPSAGCEGSLTGEGACVSFAGGPAASGVDGFWVELGEPWWRLKFTTTIESVTGDSDCYFVADDGATILGNGHNGADPCAGTLPRNAAYLFLYSYVEPHQGMTLTFEL